MHRPVVIILYKDLRREAPAHLVNKIWQIYTAEKWVDQKVSSTLLQIACSGPGSLAEEDALELVLIEVRRPGHLLADRCCR
jgi:hypothetical protein